MALYIFSDAHLGSSTPEHESHKVEQIGKLFEKVKSDGDRLIILGDLFDFWFEYKHAIPKDHHEVLFMIRQLVKSGLPVDYVSGNHDFWIGDFFEKQLGVKVHRDHLEMTYRGKKLFLIHGDGLAKADGGYRFLRRILRNRLNIRLYRLLPTDWAIPIAKRVSGTSRKHTSQRDHLFAPDYRAYAEKKIDEGYDAVFIAHLHIPIRENISKGVYINTGDFISHFSYAKVTQDTISLEYII
ncbi:MAG: UDP-2,3-diacylglucosamine diphosphatase [candidate division Zixibacteria bacterium]|nr:UDP-2,3-diacylglucosamine diphosphatase [candidate division Zixibacteria bacterium]